MRSVLLRVPRALRKNRIFNVDGTLRNTDNCLDPFIAWKRRWQEKNITLDTEDVGDEAQCDKIIVFDITKKNLEYAQKCVRKYGKDKMMVILWEPPSVRPMNWNVSNHNLFGKVFTWDDDLVDNRKYFKIYIAQPTLPFRGYEVSFQSKKLCNLISANKRSDYSYELYTERIKAIRFFEKNAPDKFDLYGFGWNKGITLAQKLLPFLKPYYPSYRGTIAEKGPLLASYKFSICYENTTNVRGYVTEKIFDCFQGGCVPVYLGADNIAAYVPENTFIDKRKFSSYEELLCFLENMDEETYYSYIKKIEEFLQTDAFKKFSGVSLADSIEKEL